MENNDGLLRLISEYELILDEALNKSKVVDIDPRNCFLDVTSNKEWNDKVCKTINLIHNDYIKNSLSYQNEISMYIRSLIRIFRENFYRLDNFKYMWMQDDYNEINFHSIDTKMYKFVKESLKTTELLIEIIHRYGECLNEELSYKFPNSFFPDDITNIINLTYDEVIKCYINNCYISAISLCGKIIETALSALYEKIYFHSLRDDKIGYDALINKLKNNGYDFKTLKEHLVIISKHRNKAIHGYVVIPTCDEARAVISLTKDALIKTTSYHLGQPDSASSSKTG